MTKHELQARLTALVNICGNTGSTAPAVAVLCTLLGALAQGTDKDLMRLCTTFSREQLAAIHAKDN